MTLRSASAGGKEYPTGPALTWPVVAGASWREPCISNRQSQTNNPFNGSGHYTIDDGLDLLFVLENTVLYPQLSIV